MYTFSAAEQNALIEAIDEYSSWQRLADRDFYNHLKACIRRGDFSQLGYEEIRVITIVSKKFLDYSNKICDGKY